MGKPFNEQSKEEILKRMRSISYYFENQAKTNPTFLPELVAAQTINKSFEELQNLSQEDVVKMIDLINDVEKSEHYNGTGWFDYKLHFGGLIGKHGFKIERSERLKLKTR